ncbi:MAG: DsbA family protein [Polyangiales bacterium]
MAGTALAEPRGQSSGINVLRCGGAAALTRHSRDARREGFAKEVSALVFGGTEDWNKGDHLETAAHAVGLDLREMEQSITDGDHTDEIDSNHDSLEAAGHWGVPTMVVRGEPFFGQDRIETLRWRLDTLNLRRA